MGDLLRTTSVPTPSLNTSWSIRVVAPPGVFQTADIADAAYMELLAARSFSGHVNIDSNSALRGSDTMGAIDFAADIPQGRSASDFWLRVLRDLPPEDEFTIYLLAGVQVPHQWDARLVAAAQALGSQAVVSPLSMRDPGYSIFERANVASSLSVEELDQWLNDYSDGRSLPMSTLSSACIAVPRGVIPAINDAIRNDAELALALRRGAVDIVATSEVCVDDNALEFCAVAPALPQASIEAMNTASPLRVLRHALTELAVRGEKPPRLVQCKPAQLHVGHSWGGGLSRWMEDYVQADTSKRHYILRSIGDLGAFGRTLALYNGWNSTAPLKTWALTEPIVSISHGSFEYRNVLDEIYHEFGIESLVVSSFIGHSLDLLDDRLPTTLVLHEFFPYCPALYATWGEPCQSCDSDRLKACFADNPQNQYFKHETPEHWLSVRERFLEKVVTYRPLLVAPSQSVLDRYTVLEPMLQSLELAVIPHGLNDAFASSLGARATTEVSPPDQRLKLLVLGRVSAEKGGELLQEMLPELAAFADLTLLGAGESGRSFEGKNGVEVIYSYTPAELAECLSQLGADLGLVISTVPETFSYTLSELWAAGIPVLATPLGALQERVEVGVNGWLVAPQASAILRMIKLLDEDRQKIRNTKAKLQSVKPRVASEMVADYARIQRPAGSVIPLSRYHLPRRSFENPYSGAAGNDSTALAVLASKPYRQALVEFLDYSAAKAQQSPGLAQPLRRVAVFVLAKASHFLAGSGRRSNR